MTNTAFKLEEVQIRHKKLLEEVEVVKAENARVHKEFRTQRSICKEQSREDYRNKLEQLNREIKKHKDQMKLREE